MAEEITGNPPVEPAAPGDANNMAETGTEGGQAGETVPPKEGAAPQEKKTNPYGMFLPLILIFAVFYFLLIRPQKKKEQQRRELLDQVRKGDKVVTIGGIIGEISSLTDREVVLRLEDNTKIRITRSAVSKIIGAEENE